MSEATPEAPAQEPTADTDTDTEAPADEQPKADETDWKAEARKWEKLAKQNSAKADKAAEQARLEAMSESDRAVAEAEAKGRTAATSEFGKRLATSEIRSTAAESGADLAGVFDYLDLARFVGDDGEPDEKAIKAFVDGLPRREIVAPGMDLGTRQPAKVGGDFNQTLRRAAGRA